eukprot:426935_1
MCQILVFLLSIVTIVQIIAIPYMEYGPCNSNTFPTDTGCRSADCDDISRIENHHCTVDEMFDCKVPNPTEWEKMFGTTGCKTACKCSTVCDVSEILSANGCSINRLEAISVDSNSDDLSIAGSIASGLLPFGSFIGIAWAAITPEMRSVDTVEYLINELREEINVIIDQLANCMDEKISLLTIGGVDDIYSVLVFKARHLNGTRGNTFKTELHNTFVKFNEDLVLIFNDEESNYLEYIKMMEVIYKILYKLYTGVAAEQLNYYNTNHENANFMNAKKSIEIVSLMFEKWIKWAKTSIKYAIKTRYNEKKSTNDCAHIYDINNVINVWEKQFDNKYVNPMMYTFRILKEYTYITPHPTTHPTTPTTYPTTYPTTHPTSFTSTPTSFPTTHPTSFTSTPTSFPTTHPTSFTSTPTSVPTTNPTSPTAFPTSSPTCHQPICPDGYECIDEICVDSSYPDGHGWGAPTAGDCHNIIRKYDREICNCNEDCMSGRCEPNIDCYLVGDLEYLKSHNVENVCVPDCHCLDYIMDCRWRTGS